MGSCPKPTEKHRLCTFTIYLKYIYKYDNSSLDLERNTENVVSDRLKVRNSGEVGCAPF